MSISRIQRRLSKKRGRDLVKLGWNEFDDITHNPETQISIQKHYTTGEGIKYPMQYGKTIFL